MKDQKDTQKTYVERLGSYYSQVTLAQIPEATVTQARRLLYDFLIVLLTGKKHTVLTPLCRRYLEVKALPEECHALGTEVKTSVDYAAMAMGIVSHGVELDDGQRHSASHPGVAIIPCALAVAEKLDAALPELIKSIIVGYDCMLRLAYSINPSHLSRGFHSTGTCGPLGAAAAAASLYQLNAEETINAIGISALQSAGIQEMLHCSASSIKPLQPGKAAMAGVLSAEFAKMGGVTPLLVFEGDYGWLKAYTDEYRKDTIIGRFGERWGSDYCYIKLYPSCRFAHAPIDISIQLYKEGFRLNNIRDIELHLCDFGIEEIGRIRRPAYFEEALYSATYSVAVALKYGFVRIEELKACLSDEEVLDFSENIQVISDAEMNKNFPDETGARIVITDVNGNRVTRYLRVAKADFDTPLEDAEYTEKAETILNGSVPSKEIQALWDLVVKQDISTVTTREIVELVSRMEHHIPNLG